MSRIKNITNTLSSLYTSTGQKLGALVHSPSKQHLQIALFVFGLVVLSVGSEWHLAAQGRNINYNAIRLTQATNGVLLYLEGSFGALVMVASGIGAILSSAFGQYKAALGLMVVAIGSFILRSLMSTFFNDAGIQQ
jgi:hypothetical protein